jgi:hypothetical protein
MSEPDDPQPANDNAATADQLTRREANRVRFMEALQAFAFRKQAAIGVAVPRAHGPASLLSREVEVVIFFSSPVGLLTAALLRAIGPFQDK